MSEVLGSGGSDEPTDSDGLTLILWLRIPGVDRDVDAATVAECLVDMVNEKRAENGGDQPDVSVEYLSAFWSNYKPKEPNRD